jgi:hypothetical protein
MAARTRSSSSKTIVTTNPIVNDITNATPPSPTDQAYRMLETRFDPAIGLMFYPNFIRTSPLAIRMCDAVVNLRANHPVVYIVLAVLVGVLPVLAILFSQLILPMALNCIGRFDEMDYIGFCYIFWGGVSVAVIILVTLVCGSATVILLPGITFAIVGLAPFILYFAIASVVAGLVLANLLMFWA